MPAESAAEEHLRIIRSLMERATIYRAISVQGALVGGVLASVGGLLLWFVRKQAADFGSMAIEFVLLWGSVFAVTSAANLFFLWRSARQRGGPFLSSGMRLAGAALGPSVLTGAGLTVIFFLEPPFLFELPAVWMICYGLGLLATAHFAPRSMSRLGWAFLCAGLCCAASLALRRPASTVDLLSASSLWMTAAFGLIHLVYAACCWRQASDAATDSPETGAEPYV